MERTARMQSPLHRTDARSKLLVTVAFLVTMLSVPLCRLPELLLFFVFPIVTCAMGGLSYGTIFRRSLVVLPFVAFIGVFNLFYDREPVFRVGALVVTAGWISFLSIVLRGLLSVQALLVLISSTGYYGLCRSMQRLGVPAVFTTQLLFVYRYLYVLIEEAAAMQQARDARSFGRKSYPLKVWGTLVGQLLIRTNNNYPHLAGYFDEQSIGIIDRNKAIETAQRKFFQAQKEVLDAPNTISTEQYEKALNVSSRTLMEYILYRNVIIKNLKQIDKKNPEADIHDIIVPRKKVCGKAGFINDLYTNNAWLLDDKYMSYSTILSDLEMNKLMPYLALDGENVDDEKRPDIAIVFSNDFHNPVGQVEVQTKTDVVIVELKKLGLPLAKREEVVSQLKQRARKLAKYYPDKIQRIWFYGIVDIDAEFRIALKEENYTELFSAGSLFYKEHTVILDEDKNIRIPFGLYVLSFDAFLKDAESRNSTFLNVLKQGFLKGCNIPKASNEQK